MTKPVEARLFICIINCINIDWLVSDNIFEILCSYQSNLSLLSFNLLLSLIDLQQKVFPQLKKSRVVIDINLFEH